MASNNEQCYFCEKKIKANAKICPYCGQDQKRSFYYLIQICAILTVFIVLMVNNGIGKSSREGSTLGFNKKYSVQTPKTVGFFDKILNGEPLMESFSKILEFSEDSLNFNEQADDYGVISSQQADATKIAQIFGIAEDTLTAFTDEFLYSQEELSAIYKILGYTEKDISMIISEMGLEDTNIKNISKMAFKKVENIVKSKDPSSEIKIKGISNSEMVFIEGGTYINAGMDKLDPKLTAILNIDGLGDFEHTISSFRIGKYEVSYIFWYKILTWAIDNGYQFQNLGREGHDGVIGASPTKLNEPVSSISSIDAIVWCNALSEYHNLINVYKDNHGQIFKSSIFTNLYEHFPLITDWTANGYRLPTEAEWQYSASNKGKTPYDFASGAIYNYKNIEEINKVAWTFNNSEGKTHSIGGKRPNTLGLYDLSGNVSEWCYDFWNNYPDKSQIDYKFSTDYPNELGRIIRGGNYTSYYDTMICFRGIGLGIYTESYIGFRLAMTY